MNLKNKNGFTLIELLAVIVVLAIIALITTPVVLGNIRLARKNSFLVSGHHIVNAGDFYYGLNEAKVSDQIYDLVNDNVIPFEKGNLKTGQLKYNATGKIAMAIWDGNYCVFKDYNDKDLTILDDDRGTYCTVDNIGIEIVDTATTGYACFDPSVTPTDPVYFTFNQATRTITAYNTLGPKDVVIPCTIGGVNVENIGTSAFSNMGLTSVMMPETLLTIGRRAFYNNSITSLDLGRGLTLIGDGAFYRNQLTELILPDSLLTISDASCTATPGFCDTPDTYSGAFAGNPLINITFGSGIQNIGFAAFHSNTSLVSVNFSKAENLNSIGRYSFYKTRIQILDIPTFTSIGTYAFYDNRLTDVNINGVSGNIGAYAFQNNLITDLNITGNIVAIGNDAFKNNQLPDEYAFVYGRDSSGETTNALVSYAGENRSNIVIPDNIENLSNMSFSGLGLTGTLDTGDGLLSIETDKFQSNSLTNVIIGNSVITVGERSFRSNNITNLSLGNSVQVIGGAAFASNQLTTVTLPDSLLVIEDGKCYASSSIWCDWPVSYIGAFASNQLTNVVFGSGITNIGNSTFNSMTTLTNVDFSRSVNLSRVGNYAFYGTRLQTLDLPRFTSIGTYAFFNNRLTSLTLNGDNGSIGTHAFRDNLLTEMNLNGMITSIGSDSFKNNQMPDEYAFVYGRDSSGNPTSNLVSYAGANRSNITIPDAVNNLANMSFSGLGLTGTLNTGDGLLSIENSKFQSNSLTNVIIGNSVTTIGVDAFSSNQIATLSLGNGVITVGEKSFRSNKITNLSLGNSVQVIGGGAFASNQLTTVTLPDSLLVIENGKCYASSSIWCDWPVSYMGAFASNQLTNIVFGSGITDIGNSTFNSMTTLTNVDFSRSVNLSRIGNYAFYGTRIQTLDLPRFTSIGTYAFFNNRLTNVNMNGVSGNIGAYAFQNNLITNLNLTGNIIAIGNDTFKNNQLPDEYAFVYGRDSGGNPTSNLVSYAGANRSNITIPDAVTNLTNASFSGLGLTGTLNTGNGLTVIENTKFQSNSLTNVIIGNSVITIGERSFRSNKIANLSLGNSVQVIGGGAFANNLLTTVTLPDSLLVIENGKCYSSSSIWCDWPVSYIGAFASNRLTNVVFGSGITNIGNSTFNSMTTLTNVDFSRSVNLSRIGNYAFYGTRMPNVEIPRNVLNIEPYAFANNSLLGNILIKGKSSSLQFNNLGTQWNGTGTIIYELESCFGYVGDTITSYDSLCSKDVTIPNELNGVTITTIDNDAFRNLGITRVEIPSTISTIGNNAFDDNAISPMLVYDKTSSSNFTSLGSNWSGASDIIYELDTDTCFKTSSGTITNYFNELICPKDIVIPSTIDTIGAYAFDNKAITSINLSSVTSIENYALRNNKLSTVTIPNTATSIGVNPFSGNLLSSMVVADGTEFASVGTSWNGNVLKVDFQGTSHINNCFTVADNSITRYFPYCSATVTIPAVIKGTNITSIGANAFKASAVQNITIGSHITSLGTSAFENNDIISLVMNDGLLSIGANAFKDTSIINASIPSTVMTIGASAYASNPGLLQINVQGKSSSNDFTSLGTNWNGTCSNIVYIGG